MRISRHYLPDVEKFVVWKNCTPISPYKGIKRLSLVDLISFTIYTTRLSILLTGEALEWFSAILYLPVNCLIVKR
jgi:hypothetical protein